MRKILNVSTYTPYSPLTSCKKPEKNNEQILRKVHHRQTDLLKVTFWIFWGTFGPKSPKRKFSRKWVKLFLKDNHLVHLIWKFGQNT